MRALLAVARADLRERLRRSSFLVAMGGAVYYGYLIDAGDVSLAYANHRGALNSAWVGTLTALSLTVALPLVGYYLIKNAVARDRETGVGELLAASPLGNRAYTAGKALSNIAVLLILAAVPLLAGLLLQVIAGEDRHFDLGALLAPVVWLALPTLILVAAIAVLTECVPWLRGTLGNLVFFFGWIALLTVSFQSGLGVIDVAGLGPVRESLASAFASRVPAADRDAFAFQIGPANQRLHADFTWAGISWSATLALRIALLVAAALALILLAALVFDRFDPTRQSRQNTAAAAGKARQGLRLPHRFPGTSFGGLVWAELRLMLEGRNRWWSLAALGLAIAGFLAPLAALRNGLLAAIWIWPLALWSGLGVREARHGTGPVIFSAPRGVLVHSLAMWVAGTLVTAAIALGAGVRMLAAGETTSFIAWAAAACFIPGLAFAMGAWSHSQRLFECTYLALWYVGALNRVPAVDYMGLTAAARAAQSGWIVLVSTALLLLAGVAGRQREAQN